MFRDKIDEKIIEHLRNDSRESFVDIGKKLKLKESAVRRGVKNLVNNRKIKKNILEESDSNNKSAIVLVSIDSAMNT